MKFLPNKNSFKSVSKKTKSSDEVIIEPQNIISEKPADVKDFDKRTFLKILGVAGHSRFGLIKICLFSKNLLKKEI